MRLRFHGLRTLGLIAAAVLMIVAGRALATPSLVMDVATGNVLYENEATHPWYPASVTKLMTVYVALSAVRDHQISLDTPLVVSRYAASMPPSKMGFRPGTEVTLGNALKMLMVKSPNDVAITIAEGIAGSVPAFAEDMNASAAQLGMRQSHFVNPNGLHNPEHYSSARDLAVLARAIYLTFPQYADLFDIGAMRVDGKIIPNHNDMLGRYPGADGMKTGFTCDSGFNLVASATRGNHHYLAVVLGAPTPRERMVRTAVLLDRAFAGIDQPQPMDADEPIGGAPEDMRDLVCHRRGRAMTAFQAETDRLEAPLLTLGQRSSALGVFTSAALAQETPAALRIAMMPVPVFDPVTLTTGPTPGYNGPIAGPRPPHTPVGTPILADNAPVAASAANEPDEDTPQAGAAHHAGAKVAASDEGDADPPPPPSKHQKVVKKIATAKSHKKVVAKEHGKHKAAKGKAAKSKHASHAAKAKPGKPAKAKVKSKTAKPASKKAKATKAAGKSHGKHSSHASH
ncbi:MAG: serine hydrolase [Methylovirgula sp.]|uniref:D-alanyl-D-alanine carboxypeptidase family protein n=1 Tax=Methylovirgula sp. TaxID=1978224 RepID=UPI0030764800